MKFYFILGLFRDTFSSSYYVASNVWIIYNKLEGVSTEAVSA
jgi:hypothetical protein